MRAMVLHRQREPLRLEERPVPKPDENQILIRVEACAVCRTDLHIVDGDLAGPKLPLVPGHQIAGVVEATGERVGVPWLAWACGRCRYCARGLENLCENARFTGYTVDGGFADYAVADERFCVPLPDGYDAGEASPLLCGGLIGFRAYRFTGEARRLGFFGFGSSAQILAQIAVADGRTVFAFTRQGDEAARRLAMECGAAWAGGAGETPPEALDAAIIFAPAGELVVTALRLVEKGGVVVCAGIHMSDIPSFPYELLWGERSLRSVANLTRDDGRALFERLTTLRIRTRRTAFPLERANDALDALRSGAITGTAVLEIAA
ncbi:MAG TPA: zinc-dependent alcohol dehydrogenase family protein [Thermoanaerobaculia bacterium]|nr:zinc-dependent alcohol dehydrogenase family protein [Thermoanaerobaculia bacterium]